MNPAQINAGVVMPSQMFGIVEIHVGAGLKPAPTNFQYARRRSGGGTAVGLP